MPHVIIKMQSGRSDQQKTEIAELVTQALTTGAKCAAEAVSVAIEDVGADEWMEQVYQPDIVANQPKLYKRPGYGPLAHIPSARR